MKPPLTIFIAKCIHTMDESCPTATAVAVSEGRIVAVGDLASMAPWQHGRTVSIDRQFENHVLLPGLIDNHIHPFLGAVLLPTEHIAPEPWRQSDGSVRPAAKTPEQYRALLLERMAAQSDSNDYFITFGYQPSVHGRYRRAQLDALFPDRPVVLLHRSFHESFFNSTALIKLGLNEQTTGLHPQINWADGHFFETGHFLALHKLLPQFLRPQWYGYGMGMLTRLMHMGGITTASGQVVAPQERLDLMQALRGITIDAAWALKLDHDIGSIVAGKRADFCVLEDDPFELGMAHLKDVRIAGTVFEGKPYVLKNPIASIHASTGNQDGLSASAINHLPTLPRTAMQSRSSSVPQPASQGLFAAALNKNARLGKRHATGKPVRYRSFAKACRDPACGNCDSARQWASLAGAVLAQ